MDTLENRNFCLPRRKTASNVIIHLSNQIHVHFIKTKVLLCYLPYFLLTNIHLPTPPSPLPISSPPRLQRGHPFSEGRVPPTRSLFSTRPPPMAEGALKTFELENWSFSLREGARLLSFFKWEIAFLAHTPCVIWLKHLSSSVVKSWNYLFFMIL